MKNSVNIAKNMFHFKGEIRCILRDENLNIVQDTGWVRNTFTTYGSNNLHTKFEYIQIGTGTGATAPTDLTLHTPISTRKLTSIGSRANTGVGGGYAFHETRGMRFEAGDGTGTIAEIGMFTDIYNTLVCRQTITPIVKASYNVLDVYYKITITPDITDTTGSVLIGGVNYDYIVRVYNVDLFDECFEGIQPHNSGFWVTPYTIVGITDNYDANGTGDGVQKISETKNDGEMLWTTRADLNEGNFTVPGGIRSAYSRLKFNETAASNNGIGVQFTSTDGPDIGTGIPKLLSQYLDINWKMTWTV